MPQSFQELLSKNAVELQVCKLDWGCISDEEASIVWMELMGWFLEKCMLDGLVSKVANFGQRNSHELVDHGKDVDSGNPDFFKIEFVCFFFTFWIFHSFVKFGNVSLRPS